MLAPRQDDLLLFRLRAISTASPATPRQLTIVDKGQMLGSRWSAANIRIPRRLVPSAVRAFRWSLKLKLPEEDFWSRINLRGRLLKWARPECSKYDWTTTRCKKERVSRLDNGGQVLYNEICCPKGKMIAIRSPVSGCKATRITFYWQKVFPRI